MVGIIQEKRIHFFHKVWREKINIEALEISIKENEKKVYI